MGNDHEDYETGAAPAAHKVSHQDGGTDEISVAGLSGETALLAAHKILPSIHHVKFTAAEARAAINNIFGSDGKADADIDLDTHKLINVVDPAAAQDADTKAARDQAITTHAESATIHQDAPQLILDHKGDASAHHTKYTDAEARASINHVHDSTGKITQHLDVNTHKLINVVDPTNNQDALTKKYFDDNTSFFCRIKTGSYTGDGTLSKAITGVGFSPKYLLIWVHPLSAGDEDLWQKVDRSWGDYAFYPRGGAFYADRVNSLDSDGFTVDDNNANNHPNALDIVYDYVAFS